jgi:hypothetical protein
MSQGIWQLGDRWQRNSCDCFDLSRQILAGARLTFIPDNDAMNHFLFHPRSQLLVNESRKTKQILLNHTFQKKDREDCREVSYCQNIPVLCGLKMRERSPH